MAMLGAAMTLWSLGDREVGNLMFDSVSICELPPFTQALLSSLIR